MISRGTYSGGKQLAECVAEKLGYRCLSREELLESVATQYGVGKDVISAALQNKPGLLEGKSLLRIHHVVYLQAAICKECKNDNLVYHGYVGHTFLGKVSHVLRVRVVADMEFRIKGAMERLNISREEAINHIKKEDHDRANWVKSIYKIEWQDPLLYDQVINLEHMSIANACELLVFSAGTIFLTTPESQKTMDDLAFSTDIRARIAMQSGVDTHGGIRDYEIEIAADDGIVTVGGKANSVAEAKKIMSIVRDTPGVKDIKSDLHIRTSGRYDFP